MTKMTWRDKDIQGQLCSHGYKLSIIFSVATEKDVIFLGDETKPLTVHLLCRKYPDYNGFGKSVTFNSGYI